MRTRFGLAIGVAVALVLGLGSTPAAPATTERMPPKLYGALKTKSFAPATVAGRFSAPRISTVSPSPTAARYRALGTVEVAFAKGDGSIRYTVFPSRTAAFNSWADYVSGTTNPVLTFEQRIRVHGLPVTAYMFLGALGECDPTPCPPTRATFVSGVVHADVSVTVRPNASNWDRVAASALVRAAYAHLKSLQ